MQGGEKYVMRSAIILFTKYYYRYENKQDRMDGTRKKTPWL
jgi:hypothetical protein